MYLAKLSHLFNGNMVLATTSYNAGPARIEKWLPPQAMPADVWIETIPWEQPREYVKNIMASMTFYERELGLPSTFAQRMQTIQTK